MLKHTQLYSLIYQTLHKTIVSQISRPVCPDLDVLLEKLYKQTPDQVLSLEDGIINDLGAYPELLSHALTLLRCCFFLAFLEVETRSIEDAYKMFDVVLLVQSRGDVFLDTLCSSFESALVQDINKSQTLKSLTQWLKILEKIENQFEYNISYAISAIELKSYSLILDQLEDPDNDIMDLLRIVAELTSEQKKTRFDLFPLKTLVVDHALTRINYLEPQEMYWKISEILGVILESERVQSMSDTIDFYLNKYQATPTQDFGTIYEYKKHIPAFPATEMFQVRLMKNIEVRSNENKNIVHTKRSGSLNIKGQPIVTIYQYAIDGDHKKKFSQEANRLNKIGKHHNIIDLHGFFYYKINQVHNFFIITEKEGKTLKDQIESKETINVKKLFKHILKALKHLESLGLSHKRINPLNIFLIQGKYKISLGSSTFFIFKNDYELSYLAPELLKIYKKEVNQQDISFIKCDVYSFGSTIFEACTLEKFYHKQDLEKVKDHDMSSVLSGILAHNPESRPLFKDIN